MGAATANGDDDVTSGVQEPTPLRSDAGGPGGRNRPAKPTGAGRADLDQAIAVLRARVEEEFRISERLDSKSRQTFAVAAGFFVVAQTVAFSAFGDVSGSESILIAVFAILAGLAVLVTGHHLATGEDLMDESDIEPDAIVKWCNDATDSEYVSVRVVSNLRDVANDRHTNNEIRGRNFDRLVVPMRLALILSMVELALAILVRI